MTSPATTDIAILRKPGQQTSLIMQQTQSANFPPVITQSLRSQVQRGDERVYLQSVRLPNGAPGIAVGSLLTVPNAGFYELYLVFDLTDAQQTLDFVQRTLALGSLALVLLIGAITYVVVRLVVGPIVIAAQTSEKLAGGQLEERIPERGEDVIATLARSFNEMADSLQQQITKLAELSRVQQRFVSDVSHELRTPLTTIRLAGDVLYDQRRLVHPDDASAPPNCCTPRCSGSRRCWPTCWRSAATTPARWSSTWSPPTSCTWSRTRSSRCDRWPTNAVPTCGWSPPAGTSTRRSTPAASVASCATWSATRSSTARGDRSWSPSTATRRAIAIAVRDNGIGMDEADAARVFDRFWRADPSRKRTIGGTGLGLSIASEDAALHDGVLQVWSRKGEGTCFRLTLPRHRGEAIVDFPVDLPPVDPRDLEAAHA